MGSTTIVKEQKFHLNLTLSTSLVTVNKKFGHLKKMVCEKEPAKEVDLKYENLGIFHLLMNSFLTKIFHFCLDFWQLGKCCDIIQ